MGAYRMTGGIRNERNGAPDGGVLVYDGDCGFCTKSVEWLARKNLLGYPARAWQNFDQRKLPATPEVLQTKVVLDRPGYAPLGGADAFAACTRASSSPFRWLGGIMGLPMVRWFARTVYRVVARNRHRMPGSSGTCRIDS